MKESIHFLLLGIMIGISVVSLAGCGSSGPRDPEPPPLLQGEELAAYETAFKDGEYQRYEKGVLDADTVIALCWMQYKIDYYPIGDMVAIELCYYEGFTKGFNIYDMP